MISIYGMFIFLVYVRGPLTLLLGLPVRYIFTDMYDMFIVSRIL
jgi:hypothetical protein